MLSFEESCGKGLIATKQSDAILQSRYLLQRQTTELGTSPLSNFRNQFVHPLNNVGFV